MSTVSASTDRNSLLAEARQEWLQQAQAKAQMNGTKVPQVPSNTALIAEDPQLAREIQEAEVTTETAVQAATTASASNSVSVLA